MRDQANSQQVVHLFPRAKMVRLKLLLLICNDNIKNINRL